MPDIVLVKDMRVNKREEMERIYQKCGTVILLLSKLIDAVLVNCGLDTDLDMFQSVGSLILEKAMTINLE
jgi:hypothetical protein